MHTAAIIEVNVTTCPATFITAQDLNKAKLIRQLKMFSEVRLAITWVMNSEMLEHCNKHEALLLAEVRNFREGLTAEEADRTGKVMSVTRSQFEDFFTPDLEFKKARYLFIRPEIFDTITRKYFL